MGKITSEDCGKSIINKMKEKRETTLDKTKLIRMSKEQKGDTITRTFNYNDSENPLSFEVTATETEILEVSIVNFADELSTGEKRYFGELPDEENDIDYKVCTGCKKEITLNKIFNGECFECFSKKAPKNFIESIKQIGVNEYISKKAQEKFDAAKESGKTTEEALQDAMKTDEES